MEQNDALQEVIGQLEKFVLKEITEGLVEIYPDASEENIQKLSLSIKAFMETDCTEKSDDELSNKITNIIKSFENSIIDTNSGNVAHSRVTNLIMTVDKAAGKLATDMVNKVFPNANLTLDDIQP